MVADDMITFISNDLVIFGFGVFIFIVATLTIIFREIRWVILPLLSCFFAVLIMLGMLGFLNWKVTVISSNFISLMLILTMSMNIHLAVRYRQLCNDMSSERHRSTSTATDLVLLRCTVVWIAGAASIHSTVTSAATRTSPSSRIQRPAEKVSLNASATEAPRPELA